MKALKRTKLVTGLVIALAAPNVFSVTMKYLDTYKTTTSYAVGSVVTFSRNTYYSLISSNLNKNPVTVPTAWRLVGTPSNTLARNVAPTATDGKIGDYFINLNPCGQSEMANNFNRLNPR